MAVKKQTSPTTTQQPKTSSSAPQTTTPSGSIDIERYKQQALGQGSGDAGNQPPSPRKYIGVKSPYWEQDEAGQWYMEPGYSRQFQNPSGVGIPSWASQMVNLTPSYYEGDEYALVSGLGLSQEAVAAIQARMAEARLMPKEYRIGTWDGDSVDAFKYVLAYANQTTQDWQKALDDLIGGAGSLPPLKGEKGPVFTAHLTNPDDIKKAYKEVSYNLLGGKFIDDAQGEVFTRTFQDQELNSQRAAFNAATGGGGTVEQAPSLGTAAETDITAVDPAGVQAKRFNDYANVLGSFLTQRSPQT